MAGGGLFDPLGTDRPTRAPRTGHSLWLIALTAVLLGLAGLFGTAAVRNGGEGGEPRVVAQIGAAHHVEPAPSPSPPPGSVDPPRALPPPSQTAMSDQEVQIENGVRVIRPRRNGAPSPSLVVKVPEPAIVAKASPNDDGLLEPGPSGPLPRVGPDGRRPADVYAGSPVPGAMGKPSIAIIVESLGSEPSGTAQVTTDWPVGVTLGFAVDGTGLAGRVARARAAGHEVVLVLPPQAGGMSGAAVTPPGGANTSSARDRLRWELSRFTGYAGVVVDATAEATAAADILEMNRRGLYVVATPPARRATSPASSARVVGPPMATVDVTVTDAPDGLERLATLARSDGSAIGIAPASPRMLAAISSFAATLADTGIALVPLGVVVNLRQSAQARTIPVATP